MTIAPILSSPFLSTPKTVPIVPAKPSSSGTVPIVPAAPAAPGSSSTSSTAERKTLGPQTATVTPGGTPTTTPALPSRGTAPIVPPAGASSAAASKRIKVDIARGRIGLGDAAASQPVPVSLPQSWLSEYSNEAFWANDVLTNPVVGGLFPLLEEAWRRMVGVELAKVGLAYAVVHQNLIVYRSKYDDMIVRLRSMFTAPTTTPEQKAQIFDLVRRMMLDVERLTPTIDLLQMLRDGRGVLVLADHKFAIVPSSSVALPADVPSVDYEGIGVLPVIAVVIIVGLCVALVAAAIWGTANAIMEPKALDADAQNKLVSAQAEGLRLLTQMAQAANNRGDTQTASALLSQQQPYFQQDIAALAAARSRVAEAEKEPGLTTVALWLGGGYLAIRALESMKK